MRHSLLVPFGLKDGRLYEPNQVANGKACGCVCPSCKRPLWAKLNAKTPHFAHAQGEDCTRGFETAVHMAVKQIIADRMEIRLPALAWTNPYSQGAPAKLVCKEILIQLESVTLEQAIDDFRPDIVAMGDGETYLVEVAVTHFIDAAKQHKIDQRKIPTFEIDVSHLKNGFTLAELSQAIFSSQDYRAQWKYHPKQKYLEQLSLLAKQVEEERIIKEAAAKKLQEDKRKQQFEQYRRLDPKGKLQINLKSVGLTDKEMLAFSAFVPWESSFGVPRIVWQSAVLAYIAKVQKGQGWQAYLPCTVNSNACMIWLSAVFEINPEVTDGEKIAVWKYFKHLEAVGVLKYLAYKDFDILIGSRKLNDLATQIMGSIEK